ncbi:DUF397 domain-containing protein [Streptomyces sp. AJS327]|uniref:DUF397 domain-containing protein n=1 Tax=Streptomyces sp. AJS327 TaxID=2545265 RepID=UPI0015DDC40F|nr:DUF397 domain-containing protein [Streptomyces sp. AJS327]MBA0052894.1 DUF397 domain-containing protein [Streptomyces sp. AJS327]
MSSMPEAREMRWVSSSYSDAQGGQCVEWAPEHAVATGEFRVRDSKVVDGPELSLSRAGFAGLVEFARREG